jgi:hypothetical protein
VVLKCPKTEIQEAEILDEKNKIFFLSKYQKILKISSVT